LKYWALRPARKATPPRAQPIEMKKVHPNIGVFVSFSGQGGVEKIILTLAEGLASMGCAVDLLPVKARGLNIGEISPLINVRPLNASHTLTSLPALVGYLRRRRPDGLLSAKDRANQVALLAKSVARVPTRLVVRMGTTTSTALRSGGWLKKNGWNLPIRLLYPLADGIVAVSHGVAADLAAITRLPPERFTVIPNPVVSERLSRMAREPVTHPWFQPGMVPVFLGAGRLTRQKDFPTLIRAFALVQRAVPSRLVILGEGRDREALLKLAQSLGIRDRVDLPGFVRNPYPFMAKASAFVLSSIWEGSPNVLTEAMALGTPVVGTDCPSGPREILGIGLYGPLVPMGDASAMAKAMKETLLNPPPRDSLIRAVEEYRVERSCLRYLDILTGANRGKPE
jgi:glycosyltransferase involved in cell wall biosynthesis